MKKKMFVIMGFLFAALIGGLLCIHIRNKNDVVRFGVIADTHVVDSNSAGRIKEALETFKAISSDIDGVLMCGDIVYQYPGEGSVSVSVSDVMYDNVLDVYKKSMGENVPYVWAVGNHEYPQHTVDAQLSAEALRFFVNKTGQETNCSTTIAGISVITAAAQDYYGNLSQETETWLMGEIKMAAEKSKKPIILMLHHPIQGTVLNVETTSCSEEFRTFLKQYPQVINLTAHEHYPAQDPNTISQDGFTAVQVPYLGINGYLSVVGESYIQSIYQALMIEIDHRNMVKVYKIDVGSGEYIGEPWEIDIPKLLKHDASAYHYTDARIENSNKPYFEEGVELFITNVTDSSARFSFRNAKNEAQDEYVQDDFVACYKVQVRECDTDVVIQEQILNSGFYLSTDPPSKMPMTIEGRVDGLISGVKYKITIIPVSPFGKEGNMLVSEFVTSNE